VDGAHYRIECRTSSRQLDIYQGLKTDGAHVIQWSYSGQQHGPNSEFRLVDAKNGYYFLRARHSDKALQVPSGTTLDGARIEQRTFDGGTRQQWEIIYAGSGHFRLKNRHNNKFLDAGGSTAQGTDIVQRGGCSDTAEQFRLIRLP
jgi:hypothetical protein